MVYRVNSDNTGKATGVSYYGPDGSENSIEADLVILAPYIYDNTRLLLLSKSDKFPNGLANSSGLVGKCLTSHPGTRAFAVFDDKYTNVYMGPSNQKHSIDDFNADNFDHSGLDFIRGAQISVSCAALDAGPIGVSMGMEPPPGVPRWGAAYRDFLAQNFARYVAITAQMEQLPYLADTIDLDPNIRDAWGLPAPRLTYDWRRPNELKRVQFLQEKVQEIGRAMGASKSLDRTRHRQRSARRSPLRRHPYGERSERLRRQQIRSELGHSPIFSWWAARPTPRLEPDLIRLSQSRRLLI